VPNQGGDLFGVQVACQNSSCGGDSACAACPLNLPYWYATVGDGCFPPAFNCCGTKNHSFLGYCPVGETCFTCPLGDGGFEQPYCVQDGCPFSCP
jgi:hypothetical protein